MDHICKTRRRPVGTLIMHPFGISMEDPGMDEGFAWADIAFGARVANGMFCDVFSCHLRCAADELPIVVKMPRSELDSAELRSVAARDVQKEIQVLRSMLSHEHVVPMLGFGTTPSDVPFVILPLLDSTLKAELPGSRESTSVWTRRSGVKRWPIERACTLGAQVSRHRANGLCQPAPSSAACGVSASLCPLTRRALAAFLDFSFFSSHPRSTTATTTRSQTLASSTVTSNLPTWASCAPPTRSPSAWSSSTSASRLCSSSRARPTPVRRSGGGSRRAREAGGTWRPR